MHETGVAAVADRGSTKMAAATNSPKVISVILLLVVPPVYHVTTVDDQTGYAQLNVPFTEFPVSAMFLSR